MKNTILVLLFLGAGLNAYCTGFDVKTSSVIAQPGMEILGEYQDNWYAIVFETPGNLNKPPRYSLLRYSSGFSNGKTSKLYPSFGEKTFYLKSAIINNKISMFYSRCELRADEESMMNKQEGRAVMPVIERQDFDINTLEPVGDAVVVFDHNDDYFSASGIDIVQSDDKSKTVVLIKPYYKYQKYKVVITDNTAGLETAKTFDFKELKEYLKFVSVGVNNNGQVYAVAKVRDDVITYQPEKKEKKVAYHLFSINKDTKEPAMADFNPEGGHVSEVQMAVLGNGDMILANDCFADEALSVFTGVSVVKFNEQLAQTGQRVITPSEKLIQLAAQYHTFSKGREFSNVELQRVLPLEGGNFMLLAEYHARTRPADKKEVELVERSFVIAFRMDENLAPVKQNFIHKKQVSALVDYAFSVQAYSRGNDVYLFYNDNWENDEEHNMNFKCTKLPAKGDAETRKILNTSNNFFISMANLFMGGKDRILFQEDRLVDYGDITKEVKLLEVTVGE